jgi:hypothetical protein
MDEGMYQEVKEECGTLATYIWLGFGAVLHILYFGFYSLFSIKSIIFFGVGIFAAAIIIGGINYQLHLLFLKILKNKIKQVSITQGKEVILKNRPLLWILQIGFAINITWIVFLVIY